MNCVKALTGGLPPLTGSYTGSFRAGFSDWNPPVLLDWAFCGFLIYKLWSRVFVYGVCMCVCSALWNSQNPASLDNLDDYIKLNIFNFIHQDLSTFTYLKADGQQWPRLSVKCLLCECSCFLLQLSFSHSPLLPLSCVSSSSSPIIPLQLLSAPKALVFHSASVFK